MQRVEHSALVPYTAEEMYQLVNDFSSYPEFMDACEKAEELNRGDDWVEGRLTLGSGGMQQSFSTRNQLHENEKVIMKAIDGPFKHFEGVWAFESVSDQGCKVNFSLEVAFSNPLLGMAAGRFFQKIGDNVVSGMIERAKTLYGSRSL